jgi:hypothetical protein
MRLPKFRIWVLMLVVALAALASIGWVWVRRSRDYSKLANQYASLEKITLSLVSSSGQSIERARASVQSAKAHVDRMDEFAGDPVAASHSDLLELIRRERVKANERLTSAVERLTQEERDAHEYRRDAVSQHAMSAAYRRSARFPWLGPPRVKPESE